jgi:hypothetical protein
MRCTWRSAVNNSEQMSRMAGMRLGAGPADVVRMVSNPSEITKRLKYQQSFPRS